VTSAPRINLLDLSPAEAESALREFALSHGVAAYRGTQAARHLWGAAPAATFDDMSDLPKSFRALLAGHFDIPRLALAAEQRSSDGTRKFLFTLHDGQAIETVAIPDGDRLTVCVSSQVGCALQCSFCATGAMGFARNLAPHEIAGQVRELAMLFPPVTATNVVFMGMGEPLVNWKSVDVALTILNDSRGIGIGARHITVSTVGWLPGIQSLAARKEQFRLAISVHAPTDALRATLMPVNTKFPLRDVIDAAAAFDRRVTFEYVMLGGVNDAPARAVELAELARRCRAFVNLIPLHPGGAMGFSPSSHEATASFARQLRAQGVEVAIRRSRGVDIAAACGQLRVERLPRRRPVPADQDGQVEEARAVGDLLDARPPHRAGGEGGPLGMP
jgi:23S rRNA (adenine2503-C2)-methyltransferase